MSRDTGSDRPEVASWVAGVLWAWPKEDRPRLRGELVATLSQEADERFGPRRAPRRWLVRECVRIVSGGVSLRRDALVRDLSELVRGVGLDARVAVRSLVRSPTFTLSAVVMISFGVGANATVLGLSLTALRAPAGFTDADELVVLWGLGERGDRQQLPADRVGRIAEQARSLEAVSFLFGVQDGAMATSANAPADHVRIATVTSNFFTVLGIAPAPAAGAGGRPIEEAPHAYVSEALWRSVLAASADGPARSLFVDGRAVSVIGVLPSDARLPLPPDAGVIGEADVWMADPRPLADVRRDDGRWIDQDSDNRGVAVARLSTDVTIADAEAEIGRLLSDDEAAHGPLLVDSVVVRSYLDDAFDHLRPLLIGISLGASALFFIALANLSTLWWARWSRRAGEIAVRSALGAGRLRLVRVLWAEASTLGAVAGGASVWVAYMMTRAVAGGVAEVLGVAAGAPTAIAWAAIFAAGAGAVLVTALPAAVAIVRRSVRRNGPVPVRRFEPRVRRSVASAQVGLSATLVVLATLLFASVHDLRGTDLGFRSDGVLSLRVSLRDADRFGGPADRARLMREVETALSELPGVQRVGLVGGLPLSGHRWSQPWGNAGEPRERWAEVADFRVVTSGYFDALGIDRVSGRTFSRDEDLNERRRVVILDETMALRFAARMGRPDDDIVGRSIAVPLDGATVEAEVVGVVRTVRHDDLRLKARGAIYVPYRQEASREVDLVLRAVGDPGALSGSVRSAVQRVDPAIPVYAVQTMDAWVDERIAPYRLTFLFLTAFAVLSLLAGAVGLYGVVASEVSRRTREIGLRMAVGASGGTLVRGFVRHGLAVAAPGLSVGLSLAALVAWTPMAASLIVDPGRPGVWLAGLVLTSGIVAVATWIPARRVASLDPAKALTKE